MRRTRLGEQWMIKSCLPAEGSIGAEPWWNKNKQRNSIWANIIASYLNIIDKYFGVDMMIIN